MDSERPVTRAQLDRLMDAARQLRAERLASGEAWIATRQALADALSPARHVVALLRGLVLHTLLRRA